ncbi:MAG: MFS transporter [Candidatus Bathyarchaeota archaeon]|nr:MFS transporter [Candidatus Bathyarchaeota archaeon]
MWRLGFFFHEIAFGLLSVFIPLYLVAFNDTSILGGPLVALGIMTSIAVFASIPASFLWGYLCDATRHYKAFILLSFSSSAIILFLMTLPVAQNILVFVALYVVMQVLHVSHEAPKNVLIAEHYSRDEWERSYGFYEALTEVGFILGLVIGLVFSLGLFSFTATLSSGVLATYTLYLCSILSLIAFILSVVLIADPMMIFERRLVGIERKIDFAYRGIESYSLRWKGSLKQENFRGFALAIVVFALATSLFFTPLPVYLKEIFNGQESMVYISYILVSIGATAGYLLIRNKARSMDLRKQLPRFVLFRSVLILALIGVIEFAFFPTLSTGLILIFLGFAFGMYYIMMISLSMELIPEGKSGLFDGLVGLGTGIGAFFGPYISAQLSYLSTFLIAASAFFLAFLILKVVAIKNR